MREILFRGKRKDNGEWVEGCLWVFDDYADISYRDQEYSEIVNTVEVIHETVGPYTGLTDKNGVKIFEGDILERGNTRGSVSYSNKLCRFVFRWKTYDKFRPDFFKECVLVDFVGIHLAEVIGNIHDNPELLKEGGEE